MGLGINFFRQFLKGAGRGGGGCLGVALDGMEVGHTPLPNVSWSTPLGTLKWFINAGQNSNFIL